MLRHASSTGLGVYDWFWILSAPRTHWRACHPKYCNFILKSCETRIDLLVNSLQESKHATFNAPSLSDKHRWNLLNKGSPEQLRTHQHHVLVLLISRDGRVRHHNIPSNSHWQGRRLPHVVWMHSQWRTESMQTLLWQRKWCSGWQSCTWGSNIYKHARLSFLIGMLLPSIKSLNLSSQCVLSECVQFWESFSNMTPLPPPLFFFFCLEYTGKVPVRFWFLGKQHALTFITARKCSIFKLIHY